MNRIPRFTPNSTNAPLAKSTSLLLVLAAFFSTLAFGTPATFAQTESVQPANETPEPDLDSILITGRCMGPIQYQVTVVDPPSDQTEASLEKAIQQTLDRINERMSTYIDDSYVSKFNVSKSTDFIACDAETALVVQRAIEISKLTEGAFDITVGPAVELWSFGRSEWRRGDSFEPPSEPEIQASLEVVGYKKLTVRMEPPGIKKSNPGVQINLSAIAKGYAVDQVWEKLAELGCKNVIVMVGGETRASGYRPSRTAWEVGVMKPDTMQREIEAVALISEGAMATSGDYENFRRVGKKRYSHTINPVTARPVEHSMASASVLAGDCMTADALATAAMVMGRTRAIELLTHEEDDYYLIDRTGDFSGLYKRYASETFPFANEASRERLENSTSEQSEASAIWPVFLASLFMFVFVILAMAVGAIFNNKPVKGSCGGLANVTNDDGETSCGICSKPVTDCVEVTGAKGS